MVGNVGFAARHKHILCFRNQTSMQPKTSKQSKQHVFIVSQLIIDYLHHIIFNICLCVYIYISFWLFLIQSLFFVDVSGQWLSETHGAGCCQVTQSPGFLSEGGPVG